MANALPGTLLDAFTLHTDRGPIEAEIRLMHAEDGTEMLWHYENGRLGFVHPARRCARCNEILTGDSAGGACVPCVDRLVLG